VKFWVWGRGPVMGDKCSTLSPAIFGHPLCPQTASEILEMSSRVREQIAKNRKNVNGPEIETGSRRGQTTSSSGRGLMVYMYVVCKFGRLGPRIDDAIRV